MTVLQIRSKSLLKFPSGAKISLNRKVEIRFQKQVSWDRSVGGWSTRQAPTQLLLESGLRASSGAYCGQNLGGLIYQHGNYLISNYYRTCKNSQSHWSGDLITIIIVITIIIIISTCILRKLSKSTKMARIVSFRQNCIYMLGVIPFGERSPMPLHQKA